jgi:hypothetical protein
MPTPTSSSSRAVYRDEFQRHRVPPIAFEPPRARSPIDVRRRRGCPVLAPMRLTREMGTSAPGRTDAIRLEAATICQLKCPLCPTTSGEIKARIGAGFLKFDDFRRIVDENPRLWRIELSNWGEIFLNPDIARIVEYAYRRSVWLTAWNGVNLNHVRDEVLEAVVRYRFRGMTCSIDGVTQATYVAYRRAGNVERVLENVRRLNDYKKRWNSEYPRLRWQMVAFPHNAHEVGAARALAAELGMVFHLKANWDPTNAPIVPPEGVAAASPAQTTAVPEAVEAPAAAPPLSGEDMSTHYCAQLWEEPQVNFDGKLLGCCVNTWGTFGPNVFEVGLSQALGGEKIDYARRMLLGQAPPRDDVPCASCGIFTQRAAAREWIQRPRERGLVPFLRRHGAGRAVVWTANRLPRRAFVAARAFGLA